MDAPAPEIALVTAGKLPEVDVDEPLLLSAIEDLHARACVRAWDDPSVDWASFDCVVVRSTWDYHHRLAAFAEWISTTAEQTLLLNPAQAMLWNTHKRYMLELGALDLPIVPTTVIPGGDPDSLGVIASTPWSRVVVKPAVSGGSFATHDLRLPLNTQDRGRVEELVATRDVLLQPYMASVDDYGERSLIWIDGQFTHAIRKTRRFEGDDERVSEAVEIADDEAAFGERTLEVLARSKAATAPDQLLYARVDLIRGPDGSLMLMELELVEPSLFLRQSPQANAAFAQAIVKRCS